MQFRLFFTKSCNSSTFGSSCMIRSLLRSKLSTLQFRSMIIRHSGTLPLSYQAMLLNYNCYKSYHFHTFFVNLYTSKLSSFSNGYFSFPYASFYKGLSKYCSLSNFSTYRSKTSFCTWFANSYAQFLRTGMTMIPIPLQLRFSLKTWQRSQTGQPKQTMSLPIMMSYWVVCTPCFFQSRGKTGQIAWLCYIFRLILSMTCEEQSVTQMSMHSVHFFAAMLAIPTPAPNSSTLFPLKKVLLLTTQRAKTIPAYHNLSPSRPCGKVQRLAISRVILQAWWMTIFQCLTLRTTWLVVVLLFALGLFPIGINILQIIGTQGNMRQQQKNNPWLNYSKLADILIEGNSCFSHLFFTWSFALIKNSQDRQLNADEVPSLGDDQLTMARFSQFQKIWEQVKNGNGKRKLFSTILLNQKSQIIKLFIISAVAYILYLSYPVLIFFDIQYVQNSQSDIPYGIMLFVLTTVRLLLYSIVSVHQKYLQSNMGINLVTTVNMMIFSKSLKFPILSNKQFTEADIINYSQIDADNLAQFASKLIFFLFGVVEIISGLVLLYVFIGLLFLIPLGIMIVINFISFRIGTVTIDYNMKILKKKDDRLNATAQMLRIIKHIKTNVQEKYFFKKINKQRQTQLQFMKKKGLLQSIMNFLYYLTSPIILSTIFLTQVYLGHQITAAKIFATITITHVFQFTAHALPRSISQIISIFNSLKRIQNFLLTEEIDKNNYETNERNDNDEKNAIIMSNGNFYSEALQKENNVDLFVKEQNEDLNESCKDILDQSDDTVQLLKDINLMIERGKFYMIFGDIGAGKSTLLLSILNEMKKSNDSSIKINGRMAYVSQRPWTMCDSLENNVLFTLNKDKQRLQTVFQAACLSQDFKVLPDRERTAIGENGINLSGGQKTRVSLGRALYSESNVFLFDDVLSAVDVHVAEFIIKEAIGKVLKGKTVVMVTHATKFAHYADKIILMKDGCIVAEGDYQIISSLSQFSEIQKKLRKKSQNIIQEYTMLQNISINSQFMKTKKSIIDVNKKEAQATNKLIIDEDCQIGSVKAQIFINYLKLSGGYCWFFMVIIGACIVYAAFQTVGAIFVQKWSESNGTDSQSLQYYVGFTFLSIIFIFIQIYAILISSVNQGRQVHNSIITRLLYSSYTNFFNRVPVGRILNRLGKDIKQLDETVGLSLSYCLMYTVQFISGLVLIVYSSSLYVLIPAAAICVIFYFIRKYYVESLYQVIRFEKMANSPVVSGFTTAVSGLTTIRAYKREKIFLEQHAKRLNQSKKMLLNKQGLQAWFQLILNYLIFILNSVCIGYGIFSTSSTSSSFGLLLISMINVNELIYYLFLEYTKFEANMICVERLYQFMDLTVESAYQDYCLKWDEKEEIIPQVFHHGKIQFRNVSIRYREDLPNIVNNLSIVINAGEKVGIIGRTGSGKSTIINTLIRITQVSNGLILIDGVQIRDIFVKSLRSQITVIDQQPVLLEASFRQNLDLSHKYSDEQLLKVLKECNLINIVDKRGGLSAMVENNSLSAGEKQLLCICRAFLKDSHIILIDEATANIDANNDRLIQNIITGKFSGKTVMTIAHRLDTLRNYDKIMVMDRGSLVQYGSPNFLYQKKGHYYQMIEKNHYKSQDKKKE